MDTKKLAQATKIVAYVLAIIVLVILFLISAAGSCFRMYGEHDVVVYMIFGGAALLANVLSILLCLFVNKYVKIVTLVPKGVCQRPSNGMTRPSNWSFGTVECTPCFFGIQRCRYVH